MRQKRSQTAFISTCLAISVGLSLCNWPIVTLAQSQQKQLNLPKRGLPGRRTGAGTRGLCTNPKQPLTALIPTTNLGLTTEKYPTFFWFVPPTPARTAEFVLSDEKSNEVYKTTFAINGQPGVISLKLPASATLPPLSVNKNYSWTFSLICNPNNPLAIDFVRGWVQRIEPNATLSNRLAKATPRDRPSVFAQAGVWNDTLSSLIELRRSNPKDQSLVTDWESLLKSVGLESIAKAPIVSCCSPNASSSQVQPTRPIPVRPLRPAPPSVTPSSRTP